MRTTYWRWWRQGTSTHLTIVSYGLAFEVRRLAFKPHWRLNRNMGGQTASTLFERATPRLVVRRIRGLVGEMLAKQFAGVDER